ncbi:MAG: hypothetical protein KTR17_05720 [Cellvibrionaceae bacterium]|nr:hypothetical protein [Cellvibrionaceae bacterium]
MLKNKLNQSFLINALFFILLGVGVLAHSEKSRDELDLVAPTIDVSPIEEALPNANLMISAKVKDNMGVDAVTLFYRSANEKNYKSIGMTQGGDGDVYFASLEDAAVRSPSIAYYIQASDKAGNSVRYGYNLSPKIIRIHSAARPQNSDIKLGSLNGAPPKQTKAKNGAMKWVLIGLGAVAVGAVASSAGGGSSDLDSDTGSVTIVAPVP